MAAIFSSLRNDDACKAQSVRLQTDFKRMNRVNLQRDLSISCVVFSVVFSCYCVLSIVAVPPEFRDRFADVDRQNSAATKLVAVQELASQDSVCLRKLGSTTNELPKKLGEVLRQHGLWVAEINAVYAGVGAGGRFAAFDLNFKSAGPYSQGWSRWSN